MTPWPKEPSGTHPIVTSFRALMRIVRENVVIAGKNVTVDRTSNGVRVNAEPRGTGGGGTVAMFRFKEHRADYMVCRTWDGENEGTQDVFIAKPEPVRSSLESEEFDGLTVNYTYDPNDLTRRTATFEGEGGTSEQQVINPRWKEDALVFAARVRGGSDVTTEEDHGEVRVQWIEIADPRAWAQIRQA